MSTIHVIGGAAATLALGAYLKWALAPVRAAYALGKQVERMGQAYRGGGTAGQ